MEQLSACNMPQRRLSLSFCHSEIKPTQSKTKHIHLIKTVLLLACARNGLSECSILSSSCLTVANKHKSPQPCKILCEAVGMLMILPLVWQVFGRKTKYWANWKSDLMMPLMEKLRDNQSDYN